MNKFQIDAKLRKTSIRKRLLFLFFAQALIVLLWCYSLVKQSVSSYEDSISFQNAKIISTFHDSIRSAEDALYSVTKFPIIENINGDSTIINELKTSNSSLDDYNYNNYVRKKIASLIGMNSNISFLSIMQDKGSHIYTTSDDVSCYYTAFDSEYKTYYQNAIDAKGSLVIMDSTKFESLHIPFPKYGFYGIRAIYSIKPYHSVGAVICGIDMSSAMNFFELSKSFTEQNIGVYDSEGRALFGTISSNIYHTLENQQKEPLEKNQLYSSILKVNNKYMLYHYALSDNNYLCVIETPYSIIVSKIAETNYLFFLFLILLVISMISITSLLIKSIESPIHKLSKACEAIKEEQFGIIVEDDASDEMNKLITSFNSMSKKVHFLIEEVYLKETLQLKTELQFLRSQINPHFMYNTLETIRSAALLDNNTEIAEMVSLFGKTLRYGVSNSATLVSVKTELDNLNDYISLQQKHFKDKLIVNRNIDPDIFNCNIIKVILQPLVENCIYHGIASIDHIGVIDILGYRELDTLIFTISDNGIGVSEKTVVEINDYINGRNNAFKGIGLRNVNRRIQLYYGNEYGILFHSVLNSGSLITLKIPIVLPEEGKDKEENQ